MCDQAKIERLVDKVIRENPDKVELIKKKPVQIGWLVGQVMRELGGKAKPEALATMFMQKLGIK